MSSSTKVLKTGLEQILEALNNGTIQTGGEEGLTLDSLIKHVGDDQRKAIQEDQAEEEADRVKRGPRRDTRPRRPMGPRGNG